MGKEGRRVWIRCLLRSDWGALQGKASQRFADKVPDGVHELVSRKNHEAVNCVLCLVPACV